VLQNLKLVRNDRELSGIGGGEGVRGENEGGNDSPTSVHASESGIASIAAKCVGGCMALAVSSVALSKHLEQRW
jgi:hypothetical protein